jgi:hypothetical protein
MTVKDGIVPIDENAPIKAKRAATLQQTTRIARFKGSVIIEQNGKWHEMNSDRFSEACYRQFGFGINKSTIADLEHLFRTTAQDLSDRAHLIDFGGAVWNMKKLDWDQEVDPKECVYRVDWQPIGNGEPIKFIMDLAKGDKGVYDDIMQSCAPIIMDKKPTGVIWYLGGGANGKSTLVHLLYKIFGPYLTEITVKQLEDERDTPQLNGKLANICKESSEGYVEDTRTYKSIGTHENFAVHKFHSQDMVQIEGNVHHIFSANNIPTFGDKSYGARRRTLVIPFQNQFKPDEMFEEKTFDDKFVERFIGEMVKYALKLKEQSYEYKFSETTNLMKEKYDTDANTAQTYADELVAADIKGFSNYNNLRMDYENWCIDHGYKPSSINVLRRAMDDKGFERKSSRDENQRVIKIYAMPGDYEMELVGQGRLGLYQLKGSKAELDNLTHEEKQEKLGEW